MRAYYSNTITEFLNQSLDAIWYDLTDLGRGDLLQTQKQAWFEQITILKSQLASYTGDIYFEYSIPRMGKRIDAVLLIAFLFGHALLAVTKQFKRCIF